MLAFLRITEEIEEELNLQGLCLLSKNGKEGLISFMEKRKTTFNT
jgi:hypothetical protein